MVKHQYYVGVLRKSEDNKTLILPQDKDSVHRLCIVLGGQMHYCAQASTVLNRNLIILSPSQKKERKNLQDYGAPLTSALHTILEFHMNIGQRKLAFNRDIIHLFAHIPPHPQNFPDRRFRQK
ncbi:hypothetical protein TNCV_2759181 [Trichonephila clavipes]|nr:hypothetical protein TNCV_2759181 [Trichonephila clavipes]